ncbi:MAG: ARMT1-like domain-containing protein, partial [Chlamydiota bacterium]|nr:ARMT1-like domain-containing protein [Chlamydiota bacterium]
MPDRLTNDLKSSDLVLFVGDLNYRRLIDERHWTGGEDFDEVVSYFPAPVAALRVVKNDMIVGVSSDATDQLTRANPKWWFEGKRALVQFSNKVSNIQRKSSPGALKIPGKGPSQAHGPPDVETQRAKLQSLVDSILPLLDTRDFEGLPLEPVKVSTKGFENDLARLDPREGFIRVRRDLYDRIKKDPQTQLILKRHEYVENVLIPRLVEEGLDLEGLTAHGVTSAIDAQINRTAAHPLLLQVIYLMKDEDLLAIASHHPNDPDGVFYEAARAELDARVKEREVVDLLQEYHAVQNELKRLPEGIEINFAGELHIKDDIDQEGAVEAIVRARQLQARMQQIRDHVRNIGVYRKHLHVMRNYSVRNDSMAYQISRLKEFQGSYNIQPLWNDQLGFLFWLVDEKGKGILYGTDRLEEADLGDTKKSIVPGNFLGEGRVLERVLAPIVRRILSGEKEAEESITEAFMDYGEILRDLDALPEGVSVLMDGSIQIQEGIDPAIVESHQSRLEEHQRRIRDLEKRVNTIRKYSKKMKKSKILSVDGNNLTYRIKRFLSFQGTYKAELIWHNVLGPVYWLVGPDKEGVAYGVDHIKNINLESAKKPVVLANYIGRGKSFPEAIQDQLRGIVTGAADAKSQAEDILSRWIPFMQEKRQPIPEMVREVSEYQGQSLRSRSDGILTLTLPGYPGNYLVMYSGLREERDYTLQFIYRGRPELFIALIDEEEKRLLVLDPSELFDEADPALPYGNFDAQRVVLIEQQAGDDTPIQQFVYDQLGSLMVQEALDQAVQKRTLKRIFKQYLSQRARIDNKIVKEYSKAFKESVTSFDGLTSTIESGGDIRIGGIVSRRTMTFNNVGRPGAPYELKLIWNDVLGPVVSLESEGTIFVYALDRFYRKRKEGDPDKT